jgi:chromosome segregation ATPase
MRTPTTAALARTFLALSLLATATTFAADKPKKEVAFGKGSGPLLTKEQLRTCMSLKARVAQLEDDLSKEQTALAATKDEIVRGGDALKARLETLDRTSAEAVAAYNEQTEARDKQIDDYQARVTAFNTRVESNKTDRDAYTKGCENRRFFEDDEIAIKKSK